MMPIFVRGAIPLSNFTNNHTRKRRRSKMLQYILILTTAGFTYGINIQKTVYESQGSTQFSHRGMRPHCASKCVMQLRHSQSSGVKYTGFTTGPCFCSTVAISEDKEPGVGYAMKRQVITQYDPPAISQSVNSVETDVFVEDVPFPLVNGSQMAVSLKATRNQFKLDWVVDESHSLLYITVQNDVVFGVENVNNTLVYPTVLGPYTDKENDLQKFSVNFYTGFVHVYHNENFLKNITTRLKSSAVTEFRVNAFHLGVNVTCFIHRTEWKSPLMKSKQN